MSNNVRSNGIMVPLRTMTSDEERDEITEDIWINGDSLIEINYEGTIAYTNHEEDDYYGVTFDVACYKNDLEYIRKIMQRYGYGIFEKQTRPYSCYWYDGADSHMSMLTLEEFLSVTKQDS